jgi:predicted dienelactone hydrolase
MKKFFHLFIFFLFVFIISGCVSSNESGSNNDKKSSSLSLYKTDQGPFQFLTIYTSWIDGSRSWDDNGTLIPTREIPLKIYAPDLVYTGTFPLILISHGLGGNTDSITYMAEHLVSYGYIIVSVQHHRSDIEYLNNHGINNLIIAAGESATRQLRLEDMSFVLDTLVFENHSINLLLHRIDTSRIGTLGHSFGAFTTLSLIGQRFDNSDFSDNRVLCGVAYSPQGTGTLGLDMNSWDNINNPAMTMAGTNDTGPGTTDPLDRREPFDNIPVGNKYHATLDGGTHGDFGDGLDFYHSWIIQMTIAFFDAYLLNDDTALSWLNKKEIEKITSYISLESK